MQEFISVVSRRNIEKKSIILPDHWLYIMTTFIFPGFVITMEPLRQSEMVTFYWECIIMKLWNSSKNFRGNYCIYWKVSSYSYFPKGVRHRRLLFNGCLFSNNQLLKRHISGSTRPTKLVHLTVAMWGDSYGHRDSTGL